MVASIGHARGPKCDTRSGDRRVGLAGRRAEGLLLVTAASLALAGCTSADQRSDEGQINAALLKTISADGKPICVDSGTVGEPLAVFRTMLPAPDPVRRLLHWSSPGPLKPGRVLSGRELVNGELRDDPSSLPEFAQDQAHLSVLAETQLNALARAAALIEPEQGVRLRDTPAAPLATVRWWPLNRIGSRCTVIFTVSKPVIKRTIAFVTVTAAHQGTTYAFQKGQGGWATTAKWSSWLY